MALGVQTGLLMKVVAGEEGMRCEVDFYRGKEKWAGNGEAGSSLSFLPSPWRRDGTPNENVKEEHSHYSLFTK